MGYATVIQAENYKPLRQRFGFKELCGDEL
jgi:hypothetical protein